MGPSVGPITEPVPHSINTRGCMWRGKVASNMPCPIGINGAPNIPWPTRAISKVSIESASPHAADERVNPASVATIKRRQPNLPASQPVSGVATAVAARNSVTIHAPSSCVRDSAPRICGTTTLVEVIARPKVSVETCTSTRIHHRRAVGSGGDAAFLPPRLSTVDACASFIGRAERACAGHREFRGWAARTGCLAGASAHEFESCDRKCTGEGQGSALGCTYGPLWTADRRREVGKHPELSSFLAESRFPPFSLGCTYQRGRNDRECLQDVR